MENWVSVPHGLSLVSLDLNWGPGCAILARAELFKDLWIFWGSSQFTWAASLFYPLYRKEAADALGHVLNLRLLINEILSFGGFFPWFNKVPVCGTQQLGGYFGGVTPPRRFRCIVSTCCNKLKCSIKKPKYCLPCCCWKLLLSISEMSGVVWTKDGVTLECIKDSKCCHPNLILTMLLHISVTPGFCQLLTASLLFGIVSLWCC